MKTAPYITVSIICVLFSLLYLSIKSMGAHLEGKKSDIVVRTIDVENGFGYEIMENGHSIVKQEYIPVLKGNQFFCTEKDARIVGEIVKNKIANNESPSISYKELIESKISLHCSQNIKNDIVP